MALRNKRREQDKVSAARPVPQQKAQAASERARPASPALALRRAASAPPSALRHADVLALQRAVGNRAVERILGKQSHAPAAVRPAPANAVQRKTVEEEEESLQRKPEARESGENRTGLPDHLKAGIENLSGVSLDDVRVHYNSAAPARVQARAYTQGAVIHVGPGQEKHLAHEAWHVVQQKQGRVKPTVQAKGLPVNDDAGLEKEADVMGERALSLSPARHAAIESNSPPISSVHTDASGGLIQLVKTEGAVKTEFTSGKITDNYTKSFLDDHISMGDITNFDAAKVHAKRDDDPKTNTVIMGAYFLKTNLKAGTWDKNEGQSRWEVTTKDKVTYQTTRRSNAQKSAAPAAPTLLTITGEGRDAGNFTIANNAVTAVTGVTAEELTAALIAFPSYPAKKDKKRTYRQSIINHVNNQRRNPQVTWVKNNFEKIGAKELDGTVKTVGDVNKIETTKEKVKVHVNMDSGNIFHLVG